MSDLFNQAQRESGPVTNIPEFTISDISMAVKRTIEGAFTLVRVRGEISKFSLPKSGHAYITLKDENAILEAVCWKGNLSRLQIRPEEGLEVICTGRLTTYPLRSGYQLVIDQMELAGQGALLKMLEQRKAKLTEEGLFDQSRKKKLPYLPTSIGVVTSPTGAVIRDILHRLSDRFPVHVMVWPVAVQGERAAAEVIRGIKGFNDMDDDAPDLIIVARGGGSFEDLLPFWDEGVVRAAAASRIPLISAVGHETDVTLIDFAADVRAPTPTAAAEMAVPVRSELLSYVGDQGQKLTRALSARITQAGLKLDAFRRTFARPERLVETHQQRLDTMNMRLARLFERLTGGYEVRLNRTAGKLRAPTHVIDQKRQALHNIATRLERAGGRITEPKQQKLSELQRVLASLSYHNVLERGYAIVKGVDGKIIADAAQLSPGDTVDMIFAKGNAKARIS
ncbi:MAG TPA: exodeoxyribonuclease VII large subunit [Alphaproteobacteria bacterium]